MASPEIVMFDRSGSELVIGFTSEAQAERMERILIAAYPEIQKAEKPEPDPEPEKSHITSRIKSQWKDGMVVEVFVENTGEREQELSVQMRLGATLEALWGGNWQLVGDFYEVHSRKPVQPGERWEFTFKALGSDRSILLLGGDMPEPVSQPEPMAAPVSQPEPESNGTLTPAGTLVYHPRIDPSRSVKDNLMRGEFGAVYEGGWGYKDAIEIVDDGDGPCLRTHMELGSHAGTKDMVRGGGFDTRTIKVEHAVLDYELRFKPGFNPVKGGKLPGLMGGDSPSGGQNADKGFSARMMWRRDAQGELYLYHLDKAHSYGESIGRGSFHFDCEGGWHAIRQEVKLNDVGQSNGFVRVWYDDELVIEVTDLRLRTKDSVLIEGVMHTVFFGGSDDSWGAARDEWVDTRDFRIYTL